MIELQPELGQTDGDRSGRTSSVPRLRIQGTAWATYNELHWWFTCARAFPANKERMKCSALEMNDKDGMRRTTAAEGGETVCRPHDSSLLPLTLNLTSNLTRLSQRDTFLDVLCNYRHLPYVTDHKVKNPLKSVNKLGSFIRIQLDPLSIFLNLWCYTAVLNF